MCEDAACDGHRETIFPELMEKVRICNEAEAKRRGLTMEEFQDGYHVIKPRRHFSMWFENFWLNFHLLKPGL
jgi:hypothetical protein